MANTLRVNTKEIKVKNADGTTTSTFERSLDFPTPEILLHETLESLAKALGADYCLHTIKNGMKVTWRAKMRNAMEKKDDNGEWEYSDEIMKSKIYDAKWQPELRITKSDEEKAEEALAALDPKVLAAVLAKQKALLKKKA